MVHGDSWSQGCLDTALPVVPCEFWSFWFPSPFSLDRVIVWRVLLVICIGVFSVVFLHVCRLLEFFPPDFSVALVARAQK